MQLRRIACAALVIGSLLGGPVSWAQSFPSRTVTIVVPFPPGGGTDTGTRVIAAKLAERWGQAVVVENKPGAAGMIGAEYVSKAKPDGYTLVMGNVGTQSINPTLYGKRISYDSQHAFEPVTLVAELPLVMLEGPSLQAKDVTSVVAIAKSKPGELTYSSSGAGSSMHLAGALFEKATGTQMLHVPYKGGGPAIADLLAGHVDLSFATILESIGFIKAGRLRALAVTSDKRYPMLADVPTLAESGLVGFNTGSWIGLLAPAGTPREIAERIASDVRAVAGTPEMRDYFLKQGAIVVAGSPAEFAALIENDRLRYAQIIHERHITTD